MSEREPITNELRAALDVDREFMRADGTVVAQTFCVDRGDFERLCDAIDAVHAGLERENAELRAKLDNIGESMHDGWVRLPLDADGEYIHIGDEMEWVRYGNDDPTIVRTVVGVGIDVFFAWSHEQGRYAQYEAHAYRHHHAPTVEDVLVKMLEKAVGYSDAHTTVATSTIAEYAAKFRLAGDTE